MDYRKGQMRFIVVLANGGDVTGFLTDHGGLAEWRGDLREWGEPLTEAVMIDFGGDEGAEDAFGHLCHLDEELGDTRFAGAVEKIIGLAFKAGRAYERDLLDKLGPCELVRRLRAVRTKAAEPEKPAERPPSEAAPSPEAASEPTSPALADDRP